MGISRGKAINWKKWNTIKHKNLSSCIKTSEEILTLEDTEIEKTKFYRNKTPVLLKYVDIENVLVQASLQNVMMDKLSGCIF